MMTRLPTTKKRTPAVRWRGLAWTEQATRQGTIRAENELVVRDATRLIQDNEVRSPGSSRGRLSMSRAVLRNRACNEGCSFIPIEDATAVG